MHKLPTKLIAVVILISTAVSSLASEARTSAVLPTAPTVLAKSTTLNPADLAKYQQRSEQSHAATTAQAAGASDTSKTVLIAVGTVVVVVGIAGLIVSHGGKGINPGISFK